jgi:hypothetical protein
VNGSSPAPYGFAGAGLRDALSGCECRGSPVHIPAAASAANRSTRFSRLRTGRSKSLVPTRRWNATCGEGRGDCMGRGYAARPYLGNNLSERGSPRIRLRYACSPASLASVGCCPRLDCHIIPHRRPSPLQCLVLAR